MRRVLLPILLVLPFVVAMSTSGASAAPYCAEVIPSSGQQEQCTVSGAVSYLMRNPVEPFTGFEPTMHAGPDGDLFYALTDTNGIAVGFGAGVARSQDAGASWDDVTPMLEGETMPPETNDPYVYVDPWTGRVFSFHMAPILLCSILSWSDDLGETWTTNPAGCGPTGVWDHQTMVAAPPTPGTEVSGEYPNVLVQCVNAIYAAMCARSLDGGATWATGQPAYVNEWVADNCGAQHGHLASEPDGTIYLPTSECGTVPVVYISRDSGQTWERSQISDIAMPFQDPTVAVDGEGTIFATFQDHEGVLWLAHSTDDGASWSDAVQVTPDGVIGTKPAMIAGDAGSIAIAYPGTDDVAGFSEIQALRDAGDQDALDALVWGGFWTVSTNADDPDASFMTVEATGADPLMRGDACDGGGRCDFQVDFIEATVTPDGQVFASLSDGCSRACVDNPGVDNDAGSVGAAVAITFDLQAVDLCATRCARFDAAPIPVTFAEATGTQSAAVERVSSDPAAVWAQRTKLDAISRAGVAERNDWAAGRP